MSFNLDNVIAVRKDKTVYRDADKAIKVFESSYSKADILNEATNHARVEETSLNIPKLHEVTRINGKWAIVTEFIKGETIAELVQKYPERADEYLELMVDIQLEIHRQRIPKLNRLKEKMNQKISASSFDATVRYELHTRLDAMPEHKKLLHGDLNESNIIIADYGTPYIIDWAHVTKGNASADAARTYLLYYLSGETERAERYLALFCKKSDTAKQYVRKWLPIVAASQSVKQREKEKELLCRWVDVMDYE